MTDAVLDAKGLRALAHPVRVQLVGLLRMHGPSTATRLAERLGLASGATSYHLRQLAAAGFVAEDTSLGNARERWWRAVHENTVIDNAELAEQEPEAMLGYVQGVVAAHTLRTQLAVASYPALPKPWREAFNMSDWSLRLTPQEAVELSEELRAVVERYRQHASGADAPSGSEHVSLILHLLPDSAAAEGGTAEGATEGGADRQGES
ncbi:ArsR/SmtB family transcription factor [Streptomyces telluris]|uniref:Helix-turn-helix domain-containing protein n=1 Tax=Streptomyces telluris TaxID=2720021 RepID=A0A9X2LBP7_9ACTN|nr:helix-turn-helix domain-containing protein [Streptomyces telluris]MCQ8768263.1 helix-turn-helix domain-containing protein [Streptomyces telluris]NJP77530.1 helix-turn-helix transcriptional regulator [Streptomyces telluris]